MQLKILLVVIAIILTVLNVGRISHSINIPFPFDPNPTPTDVVYLNDQTPTVEEARACGDVAPFPQGFPFEMYSYGICKQDPNYLAIAANWAIIAGLVFAAIYLSHKKTKRGAKNLRK